MRAPLRTTLVLLGLVAALSGTAAGATRAVEHHRQHHHRPPPPPVAGSATQTVSFTVVPAILVVVDSSGHPFEVFTNLRQTPTAAELAAVHVRTGSQHGPDTAVTAAVRAALADVHWGRPGLVWHAPPG